MIRAGVAIRLKGRKKDDDEEESLAYNLMVLPNAELCGLWSVLLFCKL